MFQKGEAEGPLGPPTGLVVGPVGPTWRRLAAALLLVSSRVFLIPLECSWLGGCVIPRRVASR